MSNVRSMPLAQALLIILLSLRHSFGFSVPDAFHLVVQSAAAAASGTLSHPAHVGGELLAAYKNQLVAQPLPTKMITGATLAVCGDAIAQSASSSSSSTIDEPRNYDVARASSFAVFDSCYRALQHFAFPVITTHLQGEFLGGAAAAAMLLFSGGATTGADDQVVALYHAAAAMEQTLASQLIIVPFMYYPAFFALTGSMQGLDAAGCIERARDNFLPLMQRNLLFWIPVQFVQFGFVPVDYQIPFLSVAGLAWTFLLSIAAGSAKQYSKPTTTDAAEQLFSMSDAMMTTTTTIAVTDVPADAQLVEV